MKYSIPSLDAVEQHGLAEQLRTRNLCCAKYGLYLSEQAITSLLEKRMAALQEHGRVEPGESVLCKLVDAFYDCPYLEQDTFTDTLCELLDTFYYFKNESCDLVTDDDLITWMREQFDVSDGSIDYLLGASLDSLFQFHYLGEE